MPPVHRVRLAQNGREEDSVLIVNDVPDQLDLMNLLLRKAGYAVLTAEDGLEAFEIAKQNHPDLVISDVSMPRMNGLEAARRLRERGATYPIMLLTARVTEADRERGRLAGADAQLDKPFSPAALAEHVRALCDAGPNREHDR